MLLRRITEHVKAQNWTAVALDFVIVVVGVFIGIQVANWNDARLDRIEERRLVAQLLDELDDEIDRKRDWIRLNTPRLGHLQQTLLTVQSDRAESVLTDEQCMVSALSHIIVFGPSTLPTLEEMLSSGGLGRIRQSATRNALMRYQTGLAPIAAAYDFIRDDFANLIDSYGDVFPRRYDPSGEPGLLPIPTRIDCNMEKLKADQRLHNKLVSNLARTQQLHNLVQDELALLGEIKHSLAGDAP